MKHIKLIIIVNCLIISISIGCKKKYPIEDFADEIVSSIQSRNTEQYYSLFPNSFQVANYGFFAYGLNYDNSESSQIFWHRPFPEFLKSVDSIEKATKPLGLEFINEMFVDFHSKLQWQEVEIIKIDTSNSEIEELRNIRDRKSVSSIRADMNIYLKENSKNYKIVCNDILYVENEKWFLRSSLSRVKLEEVK